MKNYQNWITEEKKTYDRFVKISNFNLYENQLTNDNKSSWRNQRDRPDDQSEHAQGNSNQRQFQ